MKAYTDIFQSKKLAEILPLESADMYYCYGMDIHTKGWSFDDTPTIIDNSNRIDVHVDIPCWSLATLLDILHYPHLEQNYKGKWCCRTEYADTTYLWEADNPVDACYEIIIRLYELNLL